MKWMSGYALCPVAVSMFFCLFLLLAGCGTSRGEGFAIYLTQNDVPPASMPALSHIDIAGQSVISLSDILAYDAQTHDITLTTSAYKRISKLEVPVQGRSFVVCVDKNPVYWGAFWTPISSISFDGVTIWKPGFGVARENTVRLELGYPSPSFYGGEDPRSNTQVLLSLERAGKLR